MVALDAAALRHALLATKARMSRMPLGDNRARLSDRVAELGEIFSVSRSAVRDAVRTVARPRFARRVHASRGTTILPSSDEAFSHALLKLLVRSELTMGEVMDARTAIETELIPPAVTRASHEQRT